MGFEEILLRSLLPRPANDMLMDNVIKLEGYGDANESVFPSGDL